ncbi:hypothetical protein glysoja_040083 [Glycine soja]|uniref:Uncharacterized protein n=1 Tax=Glycine soja TaxID=3848 RepID=A0A0B2QGB3_GLYSO|nr:hypothetical protein glysoja_040083 [Glycine soja]
MASDGFTDKNTVFRKLKAKCVSIAMRRTLPGRPSRMGSSSASIAPPFTAVSACTSAS